METTMTQDDSAPLDKSSQSHLQSKWQRQDEE